MSRRVFAIVIAEARASLFWPSASAQILVDVSAVTAAMLIASILLFMVKPPLGV